MSLGVDFGLDDELVVFALLAAIDNLVRQICAKAAQVALLDESLEQRQLLLLLRGFKLAPVVAEGATAELVDVEKIAHPSRYSAGCSLLFEQLRNVEVGLADDVSSRTALGLRLGQRGRHEN